MTSNSVYLLYRVRLDCRKRQQPNQMESMYVTCKLLQNALRNKEHAFVPPSLVCFGTLYGICLWDMIRWERRKEFNQVDTTYVISHKCYCRVI